VNGSTPTADPAAHLPELAGSAAQLEARRRLAAQDRHLRACAWLHRLAPLDVYYGPRPLRAVPLGQYLAEGRWAA